MINRCLWFCVGLLTIHAAMAEEAWQSSEYLQQAFFEVALHNEYAVGEQPVRKWLQPILVRMMIQPG